MKHYRPTRSFIETQLLRSSGILCAGRGLVQAKGQDWSNPEPEVSE